MTIPEIKERLTLAEVIRHYGLKADKQNRINCPFHEDKTPSMQLYYRTHTAYCFSGNCPTHGHSMDVIELVQRLEKLTKHEALEKCKTLIGGSAGNMHPAAELTKTAVLTRLFTYFKNAVHNSKPAQEYIASRGLDFRKTEIGYNAGQFHHGTRKEEHLVQSCLKYGLLIDKNLVSRTGEKAYQPFGKYCLVFALRNAQHQISGLYFRSTVNNDQAKHFYLKDRSGFYPGYPDPGTRKLVLTESIIDAATLLQLDPVTENYSVLAAYGTNGLNEEIRNAIKELTELTELVFAFDMDEAGKAAARKYAGELHQELPDLKISTLDLPCKDLNETAQAHENEIFTQLLEERTGFSFSTENLPAELISVEKETPIPVQPVPQPPKENPAPVLNIENPWKLSYRTDIARYHILGGISKLPDSLKVTLAIETETAKSRTKLDLYEARQVEKTAREAAEKLRLEASQLETDLHKLTDLLEKYREQELLKNRESEPGEESLMPLTAQEREQAEALAKDKHLVKRLNELLGKAGIVGEEKNRLFLFIIAASYKMPDPLHALIQGSSGSGKTRLLRQISDCMPPEKVTRLTRVSDKALYNYPRNFFVNRLLCLEDMDGLPEEAGFAFRELQSNGELTSATSIKLDNGQITSGQKTVKGPIASLACTTRGEIYEDNMGRVFLLAVDESAEQTKRIIDYQNEKAAGRYGSKTEQETKTALQNLVRILVPYEVQNPFAGKIHLPEEAHKIRRLNDLFQGFVKMITILHQYQRKTDDRGRLVTELSDVEAGVDILFESIVLKVDELDGSLRAFFEQLKNYLERSYPGNYRQAGFSLLEVRQALSLSKTQLFRYVNELTTLEYLRQSGGFANRGFTYKITWWDNYQAIREKIRLHLKNQLDALQPGTPGNASGTPEPTKNG